MCVGGVEGVNNCISVGVPKSHLFQAGAIQFDFCKDKFADYYKSRNEIADEFGLAETKKWILFISDFAFFSNDFLKAISSNEEELNYYNDIEDYKHRTFDIVYTYIKKFLDDTSDFIIIYRPHPSEFNSNKIMQLAENNNNFVCIRDYSVKQWIRV